MNLIIQGMEVENRDLRELAKLAGANQIERIFNVLQGRKRIFGVGLYAQIDFIVGHDSTPVLLYIRNAREKNSGSPQAAC